ncbi:MAG: response regulator [Candidatus Bathyarchaeota archaeon]|nr:response regulator [Candidatus Bathyarchaeota archaeon]
MNEKKSILIVDDERSILGSFREILESEGYRVDTAETGKEAIRKAKASHFDLALLDMRLPDIEGTELLRTIGEEVDLIYPTMPRMVNIVVTGHATLENAVESLNLGADAYLMKPVEAEKLLRVVKEKLGDKEKTGIKEERQGEPEPTHTRTIREDAPLDSLMSSARSLLEDR